ncbi:hypothetical protein [Acetivibrio mesophilus]|uniref:Haem-binding uptake Tiki superfamily ChaN domain-containing protein n=1 Tax=Acetivibrio mesophilus TaxID=2487273 RepID=A0A4Q0I6A3_9FIRM|nr:hypothetical protein [Acetivibrio mesophilus]ODM27072.1 hypothetical protein A7W90_13100 [Clostridium sp. Bc-iso-3]RXE58482.1 hypothetical protein EFD62_11910 [Acetivibrio mesophilus]HHV30087.1 hypothetical protein [Clostridium sp.]
MKKYFMSGNMKSKYMGKGRKDKILGFSLVMMLILLMTFTACSKNSDSTVEDKSAKQIYLYGERHGVEKILDKEFDLWCEYYNNKNMRHLFVELSYYTAEFLNLWMESDSDDILDEIYNDWIGTASHNPYTKEFYKNIKSKCPETIFHGTDVGHQYDSTGKRFLKYLEENNLKDTEQYKLAQEAIEQGKYFYENDDDVYRENKMVENFIREYDALNGESIMGIYGSAHTGLDALDFTNSVPCMANQLKDVYKDIIYSEDLSWLAMNPFERIVFRLLE